MWTVIRTQPLRETQFSFLLSIDGKECWVSKQHCRYKSVTQGLIEIKDWLAKKIGADISIPRQRNPLPALISELSLSDKILIDIKDNRPQQTQAFNKLWKLSRFALFMQMRSGKTKIAINIVENHFLNGNVNNVLWLCPINVIETAKSQWDKFRNTNIQVHFIGLETISGCSITRFNQIKGLMDDSAIIIDESHMIKNSNTVRSKRILSMTKDAACVGLLTGTPITRNIQDLYNQALTLDWRIFSYKNKNRFDANHLIMSDKIPGLVYDTRNIEYLTSRLDPFCFEFFEDKYNKNSSNIEITMSDEQLYFYRKIKYSILNKLENFQEKSTDIYLMFTGLSSVLSGYISARLMSRLFDEYEEVYLNNQKIDLTIEFLKNTQEKTVVWCSRVNEIQQLKSKINCLVLSGSTPFEDRDNTLKEFKDGNVRTLVSMVQIAKQGIDLSFCNKVIYIGHNFDYESRKQSEARTLAQDKEETCNYINFIYRNSLDTRIFESYKRKGNIVSEFFSLLKKDRNKAIQELKEL